MQFFSSMMRNVKKKNNAFYLKVFEHKFSAIVPNMPCNYVPNMIEYEWNCVNILCDFILNFFYICIAKFFGWLCWPKWKKRNDPNNCLLLYIIYFVSFFDIQITQVKMCWITNDSFAINTMWMKIELTQV